MVVGFNDTSSTTKGASKKDQRDSHQFKLQQRNNLSHQIPKRETSYW